MNRNTFARLFGVKRQGGESNAYGGTVGAQHLSDGSNWVAKVWKTIGAATLALALIKAGGGTLITLEDIHDRGGICAFDVVREVNMFDTMCAESDEASV